MVVPYRHFFYSNERVARSPLATASLPLTLVSAAFAGVLVLTLNVQYYRMIHSTGSIHAGLSERTPLAQLMLYRAQSFQLIAFLTFQILPGFLLMAQQLLWLVSVQFTHGNDHEVFMLAFTSFHSFFDYFSILYFIRPYRDFTLQWVRAIAGAVGVRVGGSTKVGAGSVLMVEQSKLNIHCGIGE